jgi:hypothetical protein
MVQSARKEDPMAFDVSSRGINTPSRCGSTPLFLPSALRNQTQAPQTVPSFNEMSDAIIVRLITGWGVD